MVQWVKTVPGDMGLIPELGRSLEKEMATHPSILTWKIPWTKELGGLQSTELQESEMTEQLSREKTAYYIITIPTLPQNI